MSRVISFTLIYHSHIISYNVRINIIYENLRNIIYENLRVCACKLNLELTKLKAQMTGINQSESSHVSSIMLATHCHTFLRSR